MCVVQYVMCTLLCIPVSELAFSQSYMPPSKEFFIYLIVDLKIPHQLYAYYYLGWLTLTCPIEEMSIIYTCTHHSLMNRKYTESGRDCNLVVISSSFIIVIPPTGDEYGKLD